jgi:hypothetical protein
LKVKTFVGTSESDHFTKIWTALISILLIKTGTVCFSESLESISQGLQNVLWQLGGFPQMHRTDCLTMTTAVQKAQHPEQFARRYQDLFDHYLMAGFKTNPNSPHENGDVKQRHHRFKKWLLIRRYCCVGAEISPNAGNILFLMQAF